MKKKTWRASEQDRPDVARARRAWRARQRRRGFEPSRLVLPTHSPDLNPSEKMWRKVKASLRAAQAHTLPELETAIAAALHGVTAQNAAGWFQPCGYVQK